MHDRDCDEFSRHPDLISIGDAMRARWERVAIAEQAAAEAIRIRRRSIRDLLTDAANRGEWVCVHTQQGDTWRGRVRGVGSDHVLIGPRPVFVALRSIVALETGSGS